MAEGGMGEGRMGLTFQKTGREIKAAAATRLEQVRQRLERRNQALEEFMRDPERVRSYLVRSSRQVWHHGSPSLYSEGDVSSEQMEEIRQLCERIFTLEAEAKRLSLTIAHLDDNQAFPLTYEQLVSYGFEL
jgi:hypothetical protein